MIYFVSLAVLIMDQLSKIWILETLTIHQSLPVFKGFNLFLTYNKGVSFSLFSSDHVFMPWVLTTVALLICLGIVFWLKKEHNSQIRLGLALILGGAIGNIIDRIRFGSVVDFLDIYVGPYHWPAFNVADSAICIGAFLIIVHLFLNKKENIHA